MIRLHEKDINTPEWFDHIWSIEKVHRYDAVRLKALLEHVRDGDSICELGAGVFGFAQYALAELNLNIKATVVDFSSVALKMAAEMAPALYTVLSNALDTPLALHQFDLVGAGELIEHMETPADLVWEMARLCKYDGWLVISTVNPDCEDAIKHGDYPEHLWSFTRQELIDLFSPYGRTKYRLIGDYHMIECQIA